MLPVRRYKRGECGFGIGSTIDNVGAVMRVARTSGATFYVI
jgi:hypothetical protein